MSPTPRSIPTQDGALPYNIVGDGYFCASRYCTSTTWPFSKTTFPLG